VTVRSTDPLDLGKNHQVLAYAYTLIRDLLHLRVYDPNTDTAGSDGVYLSLNLADPTSATPITHNVGIAEPIRGFFHVDYAPADPSSLQPG
jgi:hypothetical protein